MRSKFKFRELEERRSPSANTRKSLRREDGKSINGLQALSNMSQMKSNNQRKKFLNIRRVPGMEEEKMSTARNLSDKNNVETVKIRNLIAETNFVNLVCKTLIIHSWYHGLMPRSEIEELLKADGDFVVRKTTEKGFPLICLSVRHNGSVRHFPLHFEIGCWSIRTMTNIKKFEHLVEFLDHLVTNKTQIPPAGAVLKQAVPRPEYYILHDNLVTEKKLGSGAFGEVWKGKYRKDNEEIDVAVKKMKGNASKKVVGEFMQEAKLMRTLMHKNIVIVLGIAPQEEPLMIVLELAANGSLKSYCRSMRCSPLQLTKFVVDAARGMSYLSSKKVIHRDLAARNLLLGACFETKISDFGLSVSGKKEIKVDRMKLPIKWLSPETLDTLTFTTKTDVWSFGVTMWEIFMHCATDPFPNISNQEAMALIKHSTPPMKPPPDATPMIALLMLECFHKNPQMRPTFPELLKKMSPTENVEQYETNPSGLGEEAGTQSLRNKASNRKAVTTKQLTSGSEVKENKLPLVGAVSPMMQPKAPVAPMMPAPKAPVAPMMPMMPAPKAPVVPMMPMTPPIAPQPPSQPGRFVRPTNN